jgi:hypothetical protein
MRVANLAPIAWPTPPRGYGPWEQVVATLTDALVDLGVQVTPLCHRDSATRAELRSVVAHGYEADATYDVKVYEALHIARVFEEAGEYGLIHNHFDFLPLTWSRLCPSRIRRRCPTSASDLSERPGPAGRVGAKVLPATNPAITALVSDRRAPRRDCGLTGGRLCRSPRQRGQCRRDVDGRRRRS